MSPQRPTRVRGAARASTLWPVPSSARVRAGPPGCWTSARSGGRARTRELGVVRARLRREPTDGVGVLAVGEVGRTRGDSTGCDRWPSTQSARRAPPLRPHDGWQLRSALSCVGSLASHVQGPSSGRPGRCLRRFVGRPAQVIRERNVTTGSGTWRPLGLDSNLQGRPPGAPAVPPVPHRGMLELLPLDALEWPDFESLLWRILRDVEGLRHPQIYGTPGQTQLGLDIVALASDDSGVAVQSKRHKDFGPGKITEAVDAFRNTVRPFAVSRFVIGVSREVRTTASVDNIWELRKELAPVELAIWDQRELSMRLKRAPWIVIDYFGMEIARAFCEPFAVDEIAVPRHDAVAVAEAVARTPRRRPARARWPMRRSGSDRPSRAAPSTS